MKDEDWNRISEDENDPDYWTELIDRTSDAPIDKPKRKIVPHKKDWTKEELEELRKIEIPF